MQQLGNPKKKMVTAAKRSTGTGQGACSQSPKGQRRGQVGRTDSYSCLTEDPKKVGGKWISLGEFLFQIRGKVDVSEESQSSQSLTSPLSPRVPAYTNEEKTSGHAQLRPEGIQVDRMLQVKGVPWGQGR
ncbi:mCG1051099 [Mus musculus]|nr:mCG1051099 [Mus musculus]